MLERSEASLQGWALRLFASLKSGTTSVTTGTLEDILLEAEIETQLQISSAARVQISGAARMQISHAARMQIARRSGG